MNRLMILILALMLSTVLFSQTQEWFWANSIQGGQTLAVSIDNNGNTFVLGGFNGNITIGSTNLTSISCGPYGENGSMYVARLDSAGNFLWARLLGVYWPTYNFNITNDNNGNCFVTGSFYRTATFGQITIGSSGHSDSDVFVTKLDTNGNYLWARRGGGSQWDYSWGITTDSNGNCYITGSFVGTASFGTTLNANDSSEIFIAKLSPNGTWIWAIRAGGIDFDSGKAITTDSSGNVYVYGCTQGGDFGSISIGYTSLILGFIVKMDENGNTIWVRTIHTDYYGDLNYQNTIDTDKWGNITLSGSFYPSVQFDTISLSTPYSTGYYITKLNTQGEFLWATALYASSNIIINGLSIDNGGNSYVTGGYRGNGTFGSINLASTYTYPNDLFVGKVDTEGNFLWVMQSGAQNITSGRHCVVDDGGMIYLTGVFRDTAVFGDTTLTTTGDQGMFIAKLGSLSPSAGFVFDESEGLEPFSVQFTDTSSGGSGNLDNWLWDFGDGFNSSEQNPTHIYQNDGLYSVSLTVTNSLDSTNTIIRSNCINVLPRYSIIDLTTGTSLDFGTNYLGIQSQPQEIMVRNNGNGILTIQSISYAIPDSPFHVVSPLLPVDIAVGDSTIISVAFLPITASSIIDTLYIHNNSQNMPIAAVRLSGMGEYVPPKPPDGVQIVINGENAVISWEAVTETIFNTPLVPDYYLVFYNGSADVDGQYYYLGRSWALSYLHDGVAVHADNMFYRVVAYKFYGRGRPDFDSLGIEPGMPQSEVITKLRGAGL